MLTKHGPKLLEYNARFGDPETQSVLRLLDSDLYDVLLSCAEGRLSKQKVKFNSLSAACVIAASGEYPESYRKGLPIKGIAAAEAVNSCIVFHAGTKLKDGEVMTDGGRVLGVSATGKTLEQAIESAYEGLSHIKFDDMQFRKDIGS
jgi:phosphoribosylamine--glycine ligase